MPKICNYTLETAEKLLETLWEVVRRKVLTQLKKPPISFCLQKILEEIKVITGVKIEENVDIDGAEKTENNN